jgi:hypothetical protein
LIFDLPETLVRSGGGSASAARWSGWGCEREWRGGK